jgi:hypothetical protein
MLDYAMIGLENGRVWGNDDATIAFLQSCSCMLEFSTLMHTRSHHVQANPNLPPLLPQSLLSPLLLRLPLSTLVLPCLRSDWMKLRRK